MRLVDKCSLVGAVLILAANADGIEQHVGGVVEQHGVIGEVHVVVGVDPLGQDLAFVTVEGSRNVHWVGRRAASIVTGYAWWILSPSMRTGIPSRSSEADALNISTILRSSPGLGNDRASRLRTSPRSS